MDPLLTGFAGQLLDLVLEFVDMGVDPVLGKIPHGVDLVYKGHVAHEIFQMVGGLRSSMGYLGAKDIADFHKKAKFVQITPAGLHESHPHNIMITKDAPNYKKSI